MKKEAIINTGKGKQALITGASSGIGEAYGRKLASLGYDLILVARRRDRLDALAGELQRKYAVSADVLQCDLAREEGLVSTEEKIRRSANLAVLVNNAGFGTYGTFASGSLDKSLQMIAVHVTAPTRLVKAALPGMTARREGIIINVSSLGAYLPSTGNVVYGATKSYLVSFSESLQIELKGSGVTVQALCPGFTRTGFHSTPELSSIDFSFIPKFLWLSAEEVVEQSWQAAVKGQVVCIPGAIYRTTYTMQGLLNFISRNRPSNRIAASPKSNI